MQSIKRIGVCALASAACFATAGYGDVAIQDLTPVMALNKKAYEPGCFPAGTLVHTKEGLRPIEQIQVGDWVLSKHESGEGERDYKRVTKTFVHEDKQVILVNFGGRQSDGEDRWEHFAVTPEHPIWLQGKGWKNARDLKWSWPKPSLLELISPEISETRGHVRLFVTENPSHAWVPGSSTGDALGSMGVNLDINTFEVVDQNAFLKFESVRSTHRAKPEHLFHTRVYNIEVEDFHTYYIGKAGVWVHNKNITQVNPGYALTADLANMPFYSKAELYAFLEKNQIQNGVFLIESGALSQSAKDTPWNLLKKWLKHEENAPARLVGDGGRRFEYAVVYKDLLKPVGEQFRFLAIEGRKDQFTWIDQKLSLVKANDYEGVLELLYRSALRLNGVDPISRTPYSVTRRSPRCLNRTPLGGHTRHNFASR